MAGMNFFIFASELLAQSNCKSHYLRLLVKLRSEITIYPKKRTFNVSANKKLYDQLSILEFSFFWNLITPYLSVIGAPEPRSRLNKSKPQPRIYLGSGTKIPNILRDLFVK